MVCMGMMFMRCRMIWSFCRIFINRIRNFYRYLDMLFTDMFDFFLAFFLVHFLFNNLVMMFTPFLIPRCALLLRDVSFCWMARLVNLKIKD